MDEGFVDLRYGGEQGSGGESFWPSFTDIMMVVLMIFMIASTILMLRNWELVRELRATLESEREAEALALTATRTSATLEERLAQAQHEISVLRIQMLRAGEERTALKADLARARQQQQELEADKKTLTARLQHTERQLQTSSEELRQQQAELARIGAAREELEQRLQQVEQARDSELASLRNQYTEAELQLASLQGNYDELSVKYNKLIKPARSAVGKYVVSVRYRKEGDSYRLEYKKSEQSNYELLSRKQLDERLSALKKEYPGALYVKVIIPENSGLSYNEAWGFTQDILTRYDYYHQ